MKFAKFFAAFLAAATAFGCFAACTPDKGDGKVTDSPVYYTVTFDLDGGTIAGQDVSQGVRVESGTQLPLERYSPEKAGAVFGGWLSGETEYAADAQITVNSDIALKARWELKKVETFTVTFDPAGGTLNGSAETLTFSAEKNSAVDFSKYVPEREKYSFKGWEKGGTLYTEGRYTVAGDADFVAKWAKTPSADENFVFGETESGDGYVLSGLAENSTETEIVVPGYYQNKPVLKIANNVFAYNDGITAVDLSNCDRLEEIGYHNFSSCGVLESVNLEGCSSLEKIGDSCFQGNTIAEINLKGLSALKEIGNDCFRGQNGIRLDKLPVKELDFSACVSLETIGAQSFWYLNEIRELDFSNTKLADFGYKTVMACPKLEKIALPATLNLTAGCAETFSDCENISEITLDPLNIYMTVESGALMDADKTVIYKYAVKSGAANFTAPATVKTVMSWAFYKAANLTEIDFSAARPAAINFNAFAGCANAVLKAPFGRDGTYGDKSPACALGSNWNSGVKETVYGEAEKIFKFTTSLTDGASVTGESLTFTASAEYGPSYELAPCELTVKFNGDEITGEEGSYTVTLNDGENTIELTASSGGDTETKTYAINKVGKAELKTDAADGKAPDVLNIKIWAEAAGERQDLDGKELTVLFAWESSHYSGFNPVQGNVSVNYDAAEMCFNVTVNIGNINAMYFDSGCKIKFEIVNYVADPLVLTFELEC